MKIMKYMTNLVRKNKADKEKYPNFEPSSNVTHIVRLLQNGPGKASSVGTASAGSLNFDADSISEEAAPCAKNCPSKAIRKEDDAETELKINIVKTAIRFLNNRDLKGLHELLTDDMMYLFHGQNDTMVHEMSRGEIEAEMEQVNASFPDISFKYKSVKKAKCGGVAVRHLVVSGTHTGPPFGFGPFQPVEARGKKAENDPEDVHFTFRGYKISKMEFKARGAMTGPAGFYTQIGGFPLV